LDAVAAAGFGALDCDGEVGMAVELCGQSVAVGGCVGAGKLGKDFTQVDARPVGLEHNFSEIELELTGLIGAVLLLLLLVIYCLLTCVMK